MAISMDLEVQLEVIIALPGMLGIVDFSIATLIFAQHTYMQARDFIFMIPGCPSCNTKSLPGSRTTILFPHKMHPSYVENSYRLDKYVSSSGSPSLDHPCCRNCSTLESFRSHLVQVQKSFTITEESARCLA